MSLSAHRPTFAHHSSRPRRHTDNCERMKHVRIAVMALSATLGPSAHAAFAQNCPPIPTVPASQSVEGFVSKSDNSCTVAPNTYVVTQNQYRLHTSVTAYGTCTVQGFDQFFGCFASSTELRRITNVNVQVVQPNTTITLGGIVPVNASGVYQPRQEMDSRIPNTTSPFGRTWIPNVEGETTLRFTEYMTQTSCNFTPPDFTVEFPVVVVACSPKFKLVPSGDIQRLDPGQTFVWIDPNLHPNIRTAIQTSLTQGDWNNVQPHVQFVESPALCSGGHCLKFRPETANDEVPTGQCAASLISPASGSGSIVVTNTYFPSAASGWNASVLRHWVNHEIAHHLGLDEAAGCGASKSILAPTSCNAVSGFPITPPLTDSIPVNRTVYGGASRATCP